MRLVVVLFISVVLAGCAANEVPDATPSGETAYVSSQDKPLPAKAESLPEAFSLSLCNGNEEVIMLERGDPLTFVFQADASCKLEFRVRIETQGRAEPPLADHYFYEDRQNSDLLVMPVLTTTAWKPGETKVLVVRVKTLSVDRKVSYVIKPLKMVFTKVNPESGQSKPEVTREF